MMNKLTFQRKMLGMLIGGEGLEQISALAIGYGIAVQDRYLIFMGILIYCLGWTVMQLRGEIKKKNKKSKKDI